MSSNIFSTIQDFQDALLDRFCNPKRRVTAKTPWFGEDAEYEIIRDECRKQILFFEARGYYFFNEPMIDHQPHCNRFRVLLTFKPTESNM